MTSFNFFVKNEATTAYKGGIKTFITDDIYACNKPNLGTKGPKEYYILLQNV